MIPRKYTDIILSLGSVVLITIGLFVLGTTLSRASKDIKNVNTNEANTTAYYDNANINQRG